MKYLLLFCLALIMGDLANAQTSSSFASSINFIEYQRSFPRINDALKRKEDTLMKQFRDKGLPWPAKYIYLRSFKYDSQLEVWVKYEKNEKFRLFKTYRVCALAGTLGPKRMQGDYQVPEGFYYINEFNPKSAYHLSLGLNYPNVSDKILSDLEMPGGDIYIHGSCVTTGCIPITDQQIEDLYILAAHAKSEGQDFIPVHIFPIRFSNTRSNDYMARYLKDFPEYSPMAEEMKSAFDYFEKTKELPVIMINKKGEYIVEENMLVKSLEETKVVKKKAERPIKQYDESKLAKVVDKLPLHPDGNEGFQAFIDKMGKDMAAYLDENQPKAYIMVEFVIDQEGKIAYARVIKGGNDELNERLEEAFEKMPHWTPAIRLDKKVAIKLKQSIYVEKTDAFVMRKSHNK